jgi:hypothetical protein
MFLMADKIFQVFGESPNQGILSALVVVRERVLPFSLLVMVVDKRSSHECGGMMVRKSVLEYMPRAAGPHTQTSHTHKEEFEEGKSMMCDKRTGQERVRHSLFKRSCLLFVSCRVRQLCFFLPELPASSCRMHSH